MNFVVSVDDECLSLDIPILTLQPIVENAFIHGVESLESEGLIEIVGYADSDNVILQIKDNGIGMSEETKQSLLNRTHMLNHTSTGHSTGLGLGNVIRRLQLFYQCDDIYSIHSEIGKGTVVELRLPRGGL
ncbi:sensor histidine kinase [Bacillus sp. N9]